MENTLKYFAKFIVETATPIAIGSGEKGLTVDRLIARDANGLPYIPGTSLAGVIRHEVANEEMYSETIVNKLFGFEGKETGQGSRIGFSPAKLVAKDGSTVLEGIQNIDFDEGYYSFFKKMPERDHVRITHKGSADAKEHGKFDEELVHKGTRFSFEIELTGTAEDKAIWLHILQIIHAPFFRVGAGTRKGFGQFEIKNCWLKTFDLAVEADLLAFLDKSSSLNYDCSDWETFDEERLNNDRWIHYQVDLTPENFFLFGAGFGDEEVDMKPKTERFFDWSSGSPKLEEEQEYLLVPATSVKGAISHRTAFHFNRLEKVNLSRLPSNIDAVVPQFNSKEAIEAFSFGEHIDQLQIPSDSTKWKELEAEIEKMQLEEFYNASIHWREFLDESDVVKKEVEASVLPVQENNEAVKALFGYAKSRKHDGARGRVILSDVYLKKSKKAEKVFSHVAIDRFTGGGIDGALYQEKVVQTDSFQLDIFVEKKAFESKHVKEAFEGSLNDLTTGKLQLGGNTTKGHGAFKGSYQIINSQN